MSNERRQILEMLAAGKITAAEAEKLLDAINERSPDTPSEEGGSTQKKKPKFIRILVIPGSHSHEGHKHSAERVNIRIPLMLVKAGMKMSSFVPEGAREKIDEVLHDKGININLTSMKPEQLDEVMEGLKEMDIEVEDGDDKVHIFCE